MFLLGVLMPVLPWHPRLITQAIICKPSKSRFFSRCSLKLINSSYVYGGRANRKPYFDDVHILSLPSFKWTKVYEGDSPRFAHTCHRVGSRTMLTVGGVPSFDHLEGCDTQRKGINVFDMSSVTWGSVYNASAGPYTVPTLVVANIGGS